jgi:hypothetical protein
MAGVGVIPPDLRPTVVDGGTVATLLDGCLEACRRKPVTAAIRDEIVAT